MLITHINMSFLISYVKPGVDNNLPKFTQRIKWRSWHWKHILSSDLIPLHQVAYHRIISLGNVLSLWVMRKPSYSTASRSHGGFSSYSDFTSFIQRCFKWLNAAHLWVFNTAHSFACSEHNICHKNKWGWHLFTKISLLYICTAWDVRRWKHHVFMDL